MIPKRKPTVLCPYTSMDPRTEAAVKQHLPQAILEDTSADDYAYAHAVDRYWRGKRDLIIVEQDMGIEAHHIPSLAECDQDWCLFQYEGDWDNVNDGKRMLDWCLGCTKFSAKLQRQFPFQRFWDICPNLTWASVDAMIFNLIGFHAGLRPHIHGVIEHYHDYGKARSIPESPPDGFTEVVDGWRYVYRRNLDGVKGELLFKMECLDSGITDKPDQWNPDTWKAPQAFYATCTGEDPEEEQ